MIYLHSLEHTLDWSFSPLVLNECLILQFAAKPSCSKLQAEAQMSCYYSGTLFLEVTK